MTLKHPILMTLALCCYSLGSSAETGTPSQAEFDALEKRVERLEQALSMPAPPASTATTTASPKPATPPGPAAQPGHWVLDKPDEVSANWQALHSGMSQDEVRALLGAPTQIIRINWQNIWYYQTHKGNGSVVFRGDGKIDQVQSPPL